VRITRANARFQQWQALLGLRTKRQRAGGTCDVAELDLTGRTLLVIGNETTGLSAGWRQTCDTMARIPMAGSASSLNAAGVWYEAARRRRSHTA
jgi:TrmH family RNA methyltransferase